MYKYFTMCFKKKKKLTKLDIENIDLNNNEIINKNSPISLTSNDDNIQPIEEWLKNFDDTYNMRWKMHYTFWI